MVINYKIQKYYDACRLYIVLTVYIFWRKENNRYENWKTVLKEKRLKIDKSKIRYNKYDLKGKKTICK